MEVPGFNAGTHGYGVVLDPLASEAVVPEVSGWTQPELPLQWPEPEEEVSQ